jgi:hypothetical protein
MVSRGRALVVALALTALLVFASVAISNLFDGGAVRPPVTRHEYLQAQKHLTLPRGVTWPKYPEPPDPGNTVTGRGAGAGLAVLIAQNAWECNWVDAIRKHDTAGARRAHAELDSLLAHNIIVAPAGASENWTPSNPTDTPLVAFVDDGGLEQVRARYAAATAGHPHDLAQSCRVNAPR